MPTSACCNSRRARAWSDRRGVAAVEFALIVPVVLLALTGLVDLGRALSQEHTLEKGLHAGGSYAARAALPLDGATQGRIRNLVRHGNLTGTGPLLLPGWTLPGAQLTVSTVIRTAGDAEVAVIRLEARVPYQPLAPGLLGVVGLTASTLSARQEVVHVGH